MKKNPGRKERRYAKRKNAHELKMKMKNMSNPEKEYREPHPNAIEANKIREDKTNEAIDKLEIFKMIFRQETKIEKEMKKEQEARLKYRKKWLKEKGLAV